ncbi:MAG: MATE family efflux transporter [Clostridia bacterium]|nr:MATE family efflux transporter [Clostridia bacterium]
MARLSTRHSYDMTSGPLLPQLFQFSLPLIASSLLQLLYNAADVAVVGQFSGAEALAAVGSTGSLINLLVNLFIGLSLGGNVIIAHAHGAGDHQGIRKAVHTTISLALISGVAVMILGVLASRPLLHLMGSPDDVIDLASLYMTIYFLGMPANMLYNFGAGILRAVGDTRRPLLYLAVSGLVNVALNLLLVIVFRMGVAGVAIATVVSQIMSAAFVIIYLIRTEGFIHLDLRSLRIDRHYMLQILRVGLPAGIQSMLFNISNVLIQSSVNAQGSTVMAGNAAGANIEGFVYVIMNAFAQAALTFSSANRGARQYARVRRVLLVSLGTVAVLGLAVGLTVLSLGEKLLAIYNTDPNVIQMGMVRMSIILPTYFICGLMDVTASQMRGVGYSILPMIVSLTGACLFRIIWIATVFAANPAMPILYISYPISWTLTFLAHLGCYLFAALPKLRKQGLEQA